MELLEQRVVCCGGAVEEVGACMRCAKRRVLRVRCAREQGAVAAVTHDSLTHESGGRRPVTRSQWPSAPRLPVAHPILAVSLYAKKKKND